MSTERLGKCSYRIRNQRSYDDSTTIGMSERCIDYSIDSYSTVFEYSAQHYLPWLKPVELWRKIVRNRVSQFVDDECQRHAVDIAWRRQHWRIDVSVSVDPDDAKVWVDTRMTGDWTYRQAVITSEHDALTSSQQRLLHCISYLAPQLQPIVNLVKSRWRNATFLPFPSLPFFNPLPSFSLPSSHPLRSRSAPSS